MSIAVPNPSMLQEDQSTESPEDISASLEVSSRASTPEVIPPKKIVTTPKNNNNDAGEEPVLPIEKYIALGCFSFIDPSIQECDISDLQSEWHEFRNFLPEVNDVTVPYKALVTLWRAFWIRIFSSVAKGDPHKRVWRIWLLPDDIARTLVDRNGQTMRKALNHVLELINVAPQLWEGFTMTANVAYDRGMTSEDSSLFYIFNTLPSPTPDPHAPRERYSRIAMEELLESTLPVRGLSATLYPYQRRSAAAMLQKETAPKLELDPRLELRVAANGQEFFYGARDLTFLKEPRMYDTVQGGILAETMGLGKTLMSIALILATKDHWPKAPPIYTGNRVPTRSHVASLMQMAAATISRHSIPWRKVLDDHHEQTGEELTSCIKIMEDQVPIYEIPPIPIRSNRSSTFATPPEQIRLCKATIIVVPRNLVLQWQLELEKHVEAGVLKVLVMENTKTMLPTAAELATYDVILISRPRFEAEAKSRLDDLYESPLKQLHFLRIIIDEGHSFASTNTNAAVVADRLVRAERRWIMSGTPARDLMGVEVDMEALIHEGEPEDARAFRQEALEQRKSFNVYQESQSGAVKAFGMLACRFLKAQPWAISSHGDFQEAAKWDDYIYRHETYQTKTFTGFTKTLRRTLESLVVKTQPDDVERDIGLPPLHHKVVRLKPCFYDKLTANLFVLLFMSNAITSERSDQDYLFHQKSAAHLQRLIANLRQSGFSWTGFKEDAITATFGVIERYFHDPGHSCVKRDRKLMLKTAKACELALESPGWRALARTEEMGLFVDHWPEKALYVCAFEGCTNPMLVGITEVNECQKYINNNLGEDNPADPADPAEGLKEAREAAHIAIEQAKAEELEAINRRAPKKASGEKATEMLKSGVPASSFYNDTLGDKRLTAAGATTAPRKSPKKKVVLKIQQDSTEIPGTPDTSLIEEKPKSKRKPRQRLSNGETTNLELPADSPLAKTSLLGTTSAKYSYLISRILKLQEAEKILIFYNGDHIAWYLSQALDLFAIKHLIYASKLAGAARSKYIVLFETDDSHRVLLMDVGQAAHGLNVSSASRVFFVNPVFNPATEAQAIKRAHRIGQTKPVYVETLLLQGTIEEAMLERSRTMTRMEHAKASKSLTDDYGMATIIKDARCLEISKEELLPDNQMARLETPQQIFGRKRTNHEQTGLEKELFGGTQVGKSEADDVEEPVIGSKRKKRKAVSVNDDDGNGNGDMITVSRPKRSRNASGRKAKARSGATTPTVSSAPTIQADAISASTTTVPQTTSSTTPQSDHEQPPSTASLASLHTNDFTSIFGGTVP